MLGRFGCISSEFPINIIISILIGVKHITGGGELKILHCTPPRQCRRASLVICYLVAIATPHNINVVMIAIIPPSNSLWKIRWRVVQLILHSNVRSFASSSSVIFSGWQPIMLR